MAIKTTVMMKRISDEIAWIEAGIVHEQEVIASLQARLAVLKGDETVLKNAGVQDGL